MGARFAHLCYAGLSGATAVALNIAGGSDQPSRHAFVLLGNCSVHPSHAQTLDAMGCPWRSVRKRAHWDLGCYRRAARALEVLGPAAVVFHGVRTLPTMWFYARRESAIRRAVMVHTAPELLAGWAWRQVAGQALRSVDTAIAVSDAQKRWLEANPPMSSHADKLACIPNGLDVDFWRADLKPPGHSPAKLAMVGSLVRDKGQATLLHAMAALRVEGRDAQLTLVGDGPDAHDLQTLAKQLGVVDRVAFAGALPPREVRDVLQQADLYVHASPAESFGLSVAEAMLAGRAVIAAASCGMTELLDQGRFGRLVPPGDPAALAKGIAEAMDHPDEVQQRAQAAQARALEKFDRRRMSKAVESLLDSSGA
jgi:glycosyltransferase involved in cell wall biosynthesis